MSKRRSNLVLQVMAITAALVGPLVLFGVYLGFYVGEQIGYSKSILAIVFSTIGFLAGIAILSRAIARIVARTAVPRS